MANTRHSPILLQTNIHSNDISRFWLGWQRPIQDYTRRKIIQVGESVFVGGPLVLKQPLERR